MTRQTRTINKKPIFLAAYVACASLIDAAKAARIDRSLHYQWKKEDPEYAAAFEEAKLQAGDTLKDDAVVWARKGVFEQYVWQGRPQFAQRDRLKCKLPDGREIYADEFTTEQLADMAVVEQRVVTEDDPAKPLGVWRRSEGLLGKLLRAHLPDEFGDKSAVELTGKGGGAIENNFTVTFVKAGEPK